MYPGQGNVKYFNFASNLTCTMICWCKSVCFNSTTPTSPQYNNGQTKIGGKSRPGLCSLVVLSATEKRKSSKVYGKYASLKCTIKNDGLPLRNNWKALISCLICLLHVPSVETYLDLISQMLGFIFLQLIDILSRINYQIIEMFPFKYLFHIPSVKNS